MSAAGNRNKRSGAAGPQKEGAKILPFRRENTLHLGLIVFLFIFLYLVFSLVRYATRESYSSFPVGLEESLSHSRSYHALILRQEESVVSHWSGYVDFFAPEASHVSVGSIVNSVDELGSYSETIRNASDLQRLSNEELLNLKSRLRSISAAYTGDRFPSVYEGKDSINAFFMSHIGSASLAVLDQNASLNEFFHVYKSDTSGLVLYYWDGYETKQAKDLTAADFNGKQYNRKRTENLVIVGDFLYKLVDSEDWSLVLPLTAEEAAYYHDKTSLRFTFLKNGLTAEAACRVLNGADGSYLMELSLTRYLVQFATERYAEIRIDQTGEKGFKIPVSCQVAETVYLIPREYEVTDEKGGGSGFLQEVYAGSIQTTKYIQPVVYQRDEDYCYVSRDSIPAETTLVKLDSQDRFTVRLTTAISGVYRINTGYTVFCPIEILERSGEYLLVRRGTPNGIATYDSLLLNASAYSTGQILR